MTISEKEMVEEIKRTEEHNEHLELLEDHFEELGNHTFNFIAEILEEDFNALPCVDKISTYGFKATDTTEYKIKDKVFLEVERMEHAETKEIYFKLYVYGSEVDLIGLPRKEAIKK